MTRRACGTAAALLLLSLVSPALGQQYYLYSPKQLAPEETAQAKDGVLVREVPVQKGDTLFGISRRFSGHGTYYPQILLFNDIKNPDLIYSGDTLKVPVTRKQTAEEGSSIPAQKEKAAPPVGKGRKPHAGAAAPAQKQQAVARPAAETDTELSVGELKRLEKGREKVHPVKRKVTEGGQKRAVVEQVPPKQAKTPVAGESTSGHRLFEKALKAFRQGDCRTALDLFDLFLAENASSPQAADASLHKAECYLKLSAQ